MQILDSGFNCLSISKLRSEPIAYRARIRPGDEPHSGPLLIVPGAGNTFHVTNIMHILRCTSLRSGRRLHSIRHPDSTLPLLSVPGPLRFALSGVEFRLLFFSHFNLAPARTCPKCRILSLPFVGRWPGTGASVGFGADHRAHSVTQWAPAHTHAGQKVGFRTTTNERTGFRKDFTPGATGCDGRKRLTSAQKPAGGPAPATAGGVWRTVLCQLSSIPRIHTHAHTRWGEIRQKDFRR